MLPATPYWCKQNSSFPWIYIEQLNIVKSPTTIVIPRTILWSLLPRSATTTHFHDDVVKWKHFTRYWPFMRGIHRSPVNSPHKGQWREALMFSLICAWINSSVNNRKAPSRSLWRHCNIHSELASVWMDHNYTTARRFCRVYMIIIRKSLRTKFSSRYINMYSQFISFLHIDMVQVVGFLLMEGKDLPFLHNQHHGCWWPGDAICIVISNHEIDLVQPG